MVILQDILKSAIPVGQFNPDTLYDYYRRSSLQVPRWYMSPTALKAGGIQYLVVQRHGCLAVLKWRKFPWAHYAMFPPISYSGNIEDELYFINELRSVGIDIHLTYSDIDKYGLQEELVIPIKDNIEYIYSVDDLASLVGSRWSSTRNELHRLDKKGITYQYLTPALFTTDMRNLATDWKEARGKSQNTLINTLKHIGYYDRSIATLLYQGNNLLAWGMSEDVGIGVVETYNYRDYSNKVVQDPVTLVRHLEAKYIQESWPNRALITYGASIRGGSGLSLNKEKYGPIDHMQIYKLEALISLTSESYISIGGS